MSKRKASLLIPAVVSAVSALAGCSTTATMVPVEGPMSQLRPVPILLVKVDGIMGNTGNLSLSMPGGETCSGRWGSAAGAGITLGSASLFTTHGTAVYGSAFSISTGTGQNQGQALLVCNRGRTIQIEFVTGAGTANGFGIGKDNEDNLYKFVF